jgi:hypothetical protein
MEFCIWSFAIFALVGSATAKTWSYNLTLSSIWSNGGITPAQLSFTELDADES